MKISVNTVATVNQIYGSAGNPAPNGVDALVDRIGAQLGAVEETIHFGKKLEGAVIARVVTCRDHENSDHLHVCTIDDDGKVENVERDEQGLVTVVCGAPNVREGLLVAWLPPGSTVPDTYGTEDPFVLSARPLRGVVSNGMLASMRELGLGDDHEGILEIEGDIAPGTYLVDAFNLRDEAIIDIENKMFTHRPDCFGLLGVAREIEGIQHQAYKSPEWYSVKPQFPGAEGDELPLEVRNEIPELVPRFMAATLRDVEVKESPMWLRIYLAEMGIRSINNIVDYTNWFMLETGQPLHAYDYDKVKAQDANADHATLVVRFPKSGERITLLNGKEIEPRAEAMMIATNDKLIGVGGVMGGADTEVDANTKHIILECATFDMYSIRRTSMAHGLFTDAVTRNNKGQSPLQNAGVLAKIMHEIVTQANGKVASPIIDINHLDPVVMERESLFPAIAVGASFINERLGFKLSAEEMAQLLRNVEFGVNVEDETLHVTAPFWRTDVEIREDVVEEVGRLYGFDHLPLELPKRSLSPARRDPMLSFKQELRDVLSSAGANELLTYSFVHGNLLAKVDQKPELAFQLSNAISPDLQYYRMSVLPSLLDKVHGNIKAGYDSFALFEMNKSHSLLHADDDQGLPLENSSLALVFATDDKKVMKDGGAAFYEARSYLDFITKRLGIEIVVEPITEALDIPVAGPFDMSRSALVRVKSSGTVLGIIGECKTSVRKQFKLPVHTAGFELDLTALLTHRNAGAQYIQLPRFPKIEQDICLRVANDLSYGELAMFIEDQVEKLRPEQVFSVVSPIDIYQRPDDAEHKQITFRISMANYERTMTDQEVSKMLDAITLEAQEAFGAERI